MKAVTYLNAGNSQEAHSATTLSRVGMNINTQMPTALVVGGYDSAGVPYYAGQTKANYTYGHSVFFKEQGVWKIFFKDRRDDSERIKPIIATRSSTNAKISYTDYCKQPDADLSGTLLPIVLDRFTDTANTPLLNHTPDVGNNWTAAGTLGASFKISSANTLVDDSISGWDAAIQDVSIGDVFVEIEPIMPSSFGRSLTAIYVNVVDDSNYWRVEIDSSASARAVKIIEGVDAVHTTRASYTENSTFVADGVYRAAVITDADGIQANFYDRNGGASYINEEISYSVVDRPHKTATSHGFGMNSVDTGTALDNFVLYPRGTGGEYACLDEVI